MSEFVRWGIPWMGVGAVLYLIHRRQARQAHIEFTAQERWRQRMEERYWELEFDVTPLEPTPYDWSHEQADAMDEAA